MLLTNGFDPDPRVLKEARTLTKLGHNVTILCWDRTGLYSDKPNECVENVNIVRFFGNTAYGTGYKQVGKFIKFKKDVYEYLCFHDFDAIHCHDFDGLFIGYSVNKKLKLKLVYDEHDLFYMYFYGRQGVLNKIIYKFIIFYEKIMLKKVNSHIVVTPRMALLYKNLSKNIMIVTNAPYRGLFSNIEKSKSSKLRIGFIGSVRYFDEMKSLVDACDKFKEKVEIIISGRGISLENLITYTRDLDYVKITGGYKIDEIENLYRDVDITYAFYPDVTASISMPNKFFESVITETPIIANKNTEFGYEVEKNNFGYSIEGKNLKDELENIISRILDNNEELDNKIKDMRENKEKYYWEENEKILNNIYNQ